jgi:hypothetical protein
MRLLSACLAKLSSLWYEDVIIVGIVAKYFVLDVVPTLFLYQDLGT